MTRMRAKFKVTKVEDHAPSSQVLTFSAVSADKYGENGESEDNDFARWTPFGELKMSVTNPDLIGAFSEGDNVYLDFTKAD
jgi:hypothetical protein